MPKIIISLCSRHIHLLVLKHCAGVAVAQKTVLKLSPVKMEKMQIMKNVCFQ